MWRASGWILLALLTFLVGGELVFRVLPVSTATETDYYTDPQVRTYPAGHRWHTATGWDLRRAQPMRANNAGFAAEHDFQRDERAIALIGDSYIEASMLPMQQRLAHQVEQALGGQRKVYAMGNPGTSLLDYAERIRLAHQRYGVRDFVLLVEAGDVLQSVCGSGNYEGPCLDAATRLVRHEHHPPASALKRWVRRSAFAQYLFSQLKVDGHRLLRQVREQSMPGQGLPEPAAAPAASAKAVAPVAGNLPLVDAVTAAFFARVRGEVPGRLVLIVDGERGGGRPSRTWLRDERSRFVALAEAQGAVVVDAEPVFRGHYATSGLNLDVSPTDSHLNALGLKILAPSIAMAVGGN